ncbi:MAG: CdaR family protein [Myxococcota bacterium]
MRIFQNLRYKLLALIIALMLWAVASGTSDLERGFDVPIAFEAVPDNLVIVDKSTDEVNLRVQGSRAALRNVSPGGMEYRLVVAGAKQGNADYEVDITQFELPRGAKIVSRSPSSVEVKFERRGTKVVRVRPDLEGEPAAGFQVAEVVVEPERVRISGARSEVLRLTEVITETLALAGISDSFEREVKLTVGARNAWVEEPESVRVKVMVEAIPEDVEGQG